MKVVTLSALERFLSKIKELGVTTFTNDAGYLDETDLQELGYTKDGTRFELDSNGDLMPIDDDE